MKHPKMSKFHMLDLFLFRAFVKIAGILIFIVPSAFSLNNVRTTTTNLPGGSSNTHAVPCQTTYTAAVVSESDITTLWQRAFYLPIDTASAQPSPIGSNSGVLCPGIYAISGRLTIVKGNGCISPCSYHIVFDAVNSSGTRTTQWDLSAGSLGASPSVQKSFSGGTYNTNYGILLPPRVTTALIGPSQFSGYGDLFYTSNVSPLPYNYVRLDAITIFNAH